MSMDRPYDTFEPLLVKIDHYWRKGWAKAEPKISLSVKSFKLISCWFFANPFPGSEYQTCLMEFPFKQQ